MSKTASDYRLYRVQHSQDPIRVVVSIGHAQVGATTAWMGTQQFVNDDENSPRGRWKNKWQLDPGAGTDVADKLLFITTAVADVRKETDKTAVTYKISGGVDPFEFTLAESVDEPGGVVIYHVTLDFYA